MLTNNRDRVRMTLLVVILIVSLAFSGLFVAQVQADSPPQLFGDAGETRLAEGVLDPSYVARSRYVTVDIGILFDASRTPLGKDSLPEISLNLFPNTSYTGVVTRAWKDGWGAYWTGQLDGTQGGYFYLVVADGVFIAHVASQEGVYEVSWAGNDLYRAIQIDQSKFVDHPDSVIYDPPGTVLAEGALGPEADSANQIDILVAYTDDARAAEGSTAAMKARIALAVAETNTSYANSGITTRLRLVHVEEFSYAETHNLETDLNRLAFFGDGYFDMVQSFRDTYGADMVGLIVERGEPNLCGLAKTVMANPNNPYQVTVLSCATGYYSFGHEFGHLQGARHDVYVDSHTNPYSYGHGYVHTSDTPSARWRTIMAYNDKCVALGYDCTRLQWWSNPNENYGGAAMGNNKAKNYLVLNNTDYTVANFRKHKIGNDFNSSFNGSSSGWSAVSGSWGLYNSMYYRSPGAANLISSAKHSNNYGDLTYEVRMKRTGTCTTCINFISIRGTPLPLGVSNRWNEEYRFAYTNEGKFSVWKINGGSATALRDWASCRSIVQNDWNTLKVVAVGTSLVLYINDNLIWSGSETTFKVGQVGFGFYRNAAAGTLYVDWANLSNTPTAELVFDEAVAPGVDIPGGDDTQSP